jgi:hypothetical protein
MATPPTFPVSKASFYSNTYNYDPLYASDTVAQSANIAGGLGVLTRGTVLFGPVSPNPITVTTLLTTVPTAATARAILAADIDTTGGQVTGLVYTQGKFLDTAMTFSSQGAAADCAELWDWGIYVLTVEQRSGILVPMMKLPTTGGPLPQNLSAKDSLQATRDEVAAIQSAMAAYPTGVPQPPAAGIKEPAWAIAQFGMSKPTQEQQVQAQTAIAADALATQQQQQLDALTAQQNQQMSDLLKAQAQQRQQLADQQKAAMAQAQQADQTAAAPPPGA